MQVGEIGKNVDTHSEYVTLVAFLGNNGYASASQCYVIVHCLSLFFSSFFTEITPYTYRDIRCYSVRLWLRVRGIHFSACSAQPDCLRKFESHKCSAIMTTKLFNSNEPRYAVFVSSNLTHYCVFMFKKYPHFIIITHC